MPAGSSGNATLIVAGGARVLVDCGLSARETIKRIQAVGEDPARLDAIVVTHEHSDHMWGLVALSKALNTRVYISDAALEACKLGEKEKFIRRGEAISSSARFRDRGVPFQPVRDSARRRRPDGLHRQG